MRITFMGTPEFAVPSLEALVASHHEVVGVVTQPDRPRGRGKVVTPSPVKRLAQAHGLSTLQPEKMKHPELLDALRAWKPDLIVVAAFGRILPKVILDLPPRGCMNVHASLLPQYRGAAPIQWALINGDTETGITTMLMDEGMDTGAILLQESVPIEPNDTAGDLSFRLAHVGAKLLIETLCGWEAGTVHPRPQDETRATMAPLLKKEDGCIDWTRGAATIANSIRGLSPWPGAYTFLGQERLTIWRAASCAESPEHGPETHTPGTLLTMSKTQMRVATGQGVLAIFELQPANAKRMSVAQYVAGRPITAGMMLRAQPLS